MCGLSPLFFSLKCLVTVHCCPIRMAQIERGICGVRERNGVLHHHCRRFWLQVGILVFSFLCIMWFNLGLVCGFVVIATSIVVVSPPTMIMACPLATLSRQDDDDLLNLSLLV
ncbi:hypothetical protein Hanom_Chr15g01412771 [Helianthus anomalus]